MLCDSDWRAAPTTGTTRRWSSWRRSRATGTAREEALGDALAALDEGWKAASTANNLDLIAEAREAAGMESERLRAIVDELARRAAGGG